LFIDIVVNRIEINEIKMIVTLKQKQYNFISDWWKYGIGKDRKEYVALLNSKVNGVDLDFDEIIGKDRDAKLNAFSKYKSFFFNPLEGEKGSEKINTLWDKLSDGKEVSDEEVIKVVKELKLDPEKEEKVIKEILETTQPNSLYNKLQRRHNILESDQESLHDAFNRSYKPENMYKISTAKENIDKLKALQLKDEESKKFLQNFIDKSSNELSSFIKRRNLTRAGMITTGVGAVGAGGYGLYKHFKNKKENNLNTKS